MFRKVHSYTCPTPSTFLPLCCLDRAHFLGKTGYVESNKSILTHFSRCFWPDSWLMPFKLFPCCLELFYNSLGMIHLFNVRTSSCNTCVNLARCLSTHLRVCCGRGLGGSAPSASRALLVSLLCTRTGRSQQV